MSHHHLSLTPRDGLFLKDGRGWYTSSSGRASIYDWPSPTTVRGALCSASGVAIQQAESMAFSDIDWEATHSKTRVRAMLALRKPVGAECKANQIMWPTPKDAFYATGEKDVARLDPRPPSDGISSQSWTDDPYLEALWRPEAPTESKPMSSPSWWTCSDFLSWLIGDRVSRHQEKRQQESLELSRRTQVHVTIDPTTGTAKDEHLWATETLEMLQSDGHEWSIALDCELPDQLHDPADALQVTLGGKRRLTHASSLPADIFECPSELLEASQGDTRGLRLFAVTPLLFNRGWLPDGFEPAEDGTRQLYGQLPGIEDPVILRTACVPRPQHVSGWDMARHGAKPTRRLVRPGSVYFFEKVSREPFSADEVSKLWLNQIGQSPNDGFGCVVPGLWNIDN